MSEFLGLNTAFFASPPWSLWHSPAYCDSFSEPLVSGCRRKQSEVAEGPGPPATHGESRGARKGPLQGFWLSPWEHHTVSVLRLTWKRGLRERGKADRNEEGLGSSCMWPHFGNSSHDISSTPDPVSHLPIRPPQISIPHFFFFFPVSVSDHYFHPLQLFPEGWSLLLCLGVCSGDDGITADSSWAASSHPHRHPSDLSSSPTLGLREALSPCEWKRGPRAARVISPESLLETQNLRLNPNLHFPQIPGDSHTHGSPVLTGNIFQRAQLLPVPYPQGPGSRVTSEAACSGKPPRGSGRNLALQLRHWIGQKLPKFKVRAQAILQEGFKP